MIHYADSSSLVSCYSVDANSSEARSYLAATEVQLLWTALHALEVRNAFKLGIFRGLYGPVESAAAWENIENDLRTGRLARATINWSAAFRMASIFSQRHSTNVGSRSLDILHVASARCLRADEFVSFDLRQRALATAIGLKVSP